MGDLLMRGLSSVTGGATSIDGMTERPAGHDAPMPSSAGLRIAVMQPYWAPYLGYFELIRQTGLFVIFDDVQHIRRGWVHRNKLRDRNGQWQWLTLPLAYAPQDALISELVFAPDAKAHMLAEMRRFPAFDEGRLPTDLRELVADTTGPFVRYCTRVMVACCGHLGIKPRVMHADDLFLPRTLRGQARIIAICKLLGATEYLNASGGRGLYYAEDFAKEGIKLEFLPEWDGEMASVLQVLSERKP
jgi:hypothetical protein